MWRFVDESVSRDTSLADFGTNADEAEAESEREESEAEAETESEAELESESGAESERCSRSDSAGEGDSESLVDSDADIEPARATYDWTPGGIACECCGESVEKRWRDEGEMVCADCKEW
ncbi:DUF7573 domain-containing protein [Haladaptatus cibarius]|uniref:DUF7573 domain-containing protein n=1 Tax=Haladaptatus cibarius TaxID=453847 RepID=UPI0006792D71|nr:hypothetical protein [Haladaptatus cibarius]